MIARELLDIICCPRCAGALVVSHSDLRCCSCGADYEVVEGIPVLLDSIVSNWDVELAKEKWHSFYVNYDWEKERRDYDPANLPYIYKYLSSISENSLFLELGSGPSFLSFDLAGKKVRVVCVDFDLEVLRRAKACFQEHGRTGYFICANVQKLPFKGGVFDFAVGLGVLEHSVNLLGSLREVRRILKEGGCTFQTLPCISFLTLLNASLRYGNVPHVPILSALIRWMHVELFKTKFMRYGYEESYSQGYLQRQFTESSFTEIEMGFYDHDQVILKKWSRGLSKISRRLIKLRPFWDIVCVKAFNG